MAKKLVRTGFKNTLEAERWAQTEFDKVWGKSNVLLTSEILNDRKFGAEVAEAALHAISGKDSIAKTIILKYENEEMGKEWAAMITIPERSSKKIAEAMERKLDLGKLKWILDSEIDNLVKKEGHALSASDVVFDVFEFDDKVSLALRYSTPMNNSEVFEFSINESGEIKKKNKCKENDELDVFLSVTMIVENAVKASKINNRVRAS